MEGMTADQLKRHLYRRFEKQGVLDNLKAKLRNQLAIEISSENIHEKSTPDDKNPDELRNIPKLVTTWLIMDQLRRQSFDLTISTFMAEMTAKAKCNKADFGLGFDSFQKNDVLDILGLDRSDISFETGALCELINLIIDRRISKHDQVQTVDERPKSFAINQPIYDKLQNLGRVLNAVNETELEDLKDEGRPFKRMELIYVDKLKQLQDRENSLLDGMDKERKALEELSYQQRESILREIDSVKLREQESRLRLEERQSDLKVFEERLEKQFRELKQKKEQAECLSKNLKQIVSSQCEKYRLKLEEELSSRINKIKQHETEIQSRLSRFSEQEKLVDEIKLKHVKNFELEVRLEQATKEGTKHQAEIAIQQQRLRATWDYDQVKSAYSESMQQTNELKIQLDAATGERERQDRLIKELSTKLSEPSDTVLNLQRQLNELQKKKVGDENVLREEIKNLKTNLVSSEHKLKESQELLQIEVEKLRNVSAALTETKIALSESQAAFRSHLNFKRYDYISQESYFDTSLRATIPPELKLQSHIAARQTESGRPLVNEEFIRKAKLRLQKLELEAKNISRIRNSFTKLRADETPDKDSAKYSKLTDYSNHSSAKQLPLSLNHQVRDGGLAKTPENQLRDTPPKRMSSAGVKRALFADEEIEIVDFGAAGVEHYFEFSNVLHTSTPRQHSGTASPPPTRAENNVEYRLPGKTSPSTGEAKQKLNPYQLITIDNQTNLSILNEDDSSTAKVTDVAPKTAPPVDENGSSSNEKRQQNEVARKEAAAVEPGVEKSPAVSENTETLSSIRISAGNVAEDLPSNNAKDDFSW